MWPCNEDAAAELPEPVLVPHELTDAVNIDLVVQSEAEAPILVRPVGEVPSGICPRSKAKGGPATTACDKFAVLKTDIEMAAATIVKFTNEVAVLEREVASLEAAAQTPVPEIYEFEFELAIALWIHV